MEPRRTAPDILVDHARLEYEPVVCLSLGLTHGANTVVLSHDDPSDSPEGPSRAGAATATTQEAVVALVLGLVAATMANAGPAASVAMDLPGRTPGGALVDTVERILLRHGVATTAISFTLSAEDAMRDLSTTTATVAALRDLGCRVGIDGVGATFASVRLLHVLPMDFARIDPGLVANLLADPTTLTEVSAILRLADDVGVPTTAVGVESYEQAQWLRDLGCRFGAGPFFGNPCDWLVLPSPHQCDAG